MKEIKLKPKEIKELKELSDKEEALRYSIESLSLAAYKTHNELWGKIYQWYPETQGYFECSYNTKTGTITQKEP